MAKKITTKKALSTSGANHVGGGGRRKKENKMNQNTKPLYGVINLILKISLVIAGITVMQMPFVHFIVDIPLYQAVGGVLMTFIVYLELYAYFAKPEASKKKKAEPKSALQRVATNFIET